MVFLVGDFDSRVSRELCVFSLRRLLQLLLRLHLTVLDFLRGLRLFFIFHCIYAEPCDGLFQFLTELLNGGLAALSSRQPRR